MNFQDRYESIYGGLDQTPHRILVVDDEESVRELLADLLTKEGYGVTVAVDGEQAMELLESSTFDLIITDGNMPGLGGREVLQAAKRLDPWFPVIVSSGHPSSESWVGLINHPRTEVIPKPFAVESIKQTVADLLITQQSGQPPL